MAELLNGPLLVFALVVLAGIALRYALWMGTERTAVSQQTRPDQRNKELEALVRRLRNSESDLQNECSRIREDYESLRLALDARGPATNELDTDEAIACATAESRDKIQMLEAQLAKSSKERDQANAQQAQATAKFHEKIELLEAQLDKSSKECDQANARLADQDARTATLNQQLEEVRRQLNGQKQERHSLLQLRDKLHSQSAEQSERVTLIATERDALLEECDRLRAALQAMESNVSDRDALEEAQTTAVARQKELEGELRQLALQYQELSATCRELESQCEHLTAERDSAILEANAQKTNYDELLEVRKRESDDARQAAQDLRNQLDAERELANQQATGAESTVADLKEQIAAMHRQLVKQREAADALEGHAQSVAEISDERDRLRDELSRLSQDLESARQDHADQFSKAERLFDQKFTGLNRLLDATRSDLDSICSAEAALRQELQVKSEQLEQANHSRERLQSQLAAITAKLEEGEQYVAEHDERYANICVERDELVLGIRREQANAQQLTSEIEEMRRTLRKQEMELSHLELLRKDHSCVSEEYRELQADFETTRTERDQLKSNFAATSEELTSLQSRLRTIEDEANGKIALASHLRQENDQLKMEVAKMRTENRTLEELITVHSETLQKLRADSLSIETLLERQAAVRDSLQEHSIRLHAVTKDRHDHDEPAATVKIAAPFEHEHAAEDDGEIIAFDNDQRNARIDSVLGLVYDRPPTHCDPLQQISGIGPMLEHKLNRLGIYRFEQIRDLNGPAIEELSRLLAFKDRIQRDSWVSQANRLAKSTRNRVA